MTVKRTVRDALSSKQTYLFLIVRNKDNIEIGGLPICNPSQREFLAKPVHILLATKKIAE